MRVAMIFALLTWRSSAALAAQDADYLSEMPSATQVVADIPGSDPDARARQVAALERLARIVRECRGQAGMNGRHGQMLQATVSKGQSEGFSTR